MLNHPESAQGIVREITWGIPQGGPRDPARDPLADPLGDPPLDPWVFLGEVWVVVSSGWWF